MKVRIAAFVGLFSFIAATASEAVPYSIIVPSAMTIDTLHASGAGLAVWVVAGSSPLFEPHNPSNPVRYDFSTTGVGDLFALMFATTFANGNGLQPGQAYAPANPQTAPLAPYLPTSLTRVVGSDTGFAVNMHFAFLSQVPGYVGQHAIPFSFSFGQDVVRFTTLVSFAPGVSTHGPLGAVTITGVQQVASVFDPIYQPNSTPQGVPESSTLFVGLIGLTATALVSLKK